MRILAADTTSSFGSIALVEDGVLRGIQGVGPASHHAERLIPSLDWLLGALELELQQLDALAVASGPGSFTGTRIGIATMEGLAFTTNKSIVGISALEATAYPLRWQARWIAPVLNAYRGEVYASLYRSEQGDLSQAIEPVCETPEAFSKRLPNETVWVVGSGAPSHGQQWRDERGELIRIADSQFFLAEAVARLAIAALSGGAAGKGVEAHYIRPSEAERNRKKS